jgi:hypothetical protein
LDRWSRLPGFAFGIRDANLNRTPVVKRGEDGIDQGHCLLKLGVLAQDDNDSRELKDQGLLSARLSNPPTEAGIPSRVRRVEDPLEPFGEHGR